MGHEAELVSKMCHLFQDEAVRFYSCGGVSTLFHVLRGIDSFEKREIAFFPNGREADFLENFSRKYLFFNLESLIEGSAVNIDYVQLKDFVCYNTISVGADARIQSIVDKIIKSISINNSIVYKFAFILDTLIGFKPEELHITIDGVNYDGTYLLAHVSNGKCYNSILYPTKDRSPMDGKLDILLWKETTTMRWVKGYAHYKAGRLEKLSDMLIHVRGKEFEIASSDGRELLFHCDGVERTQASVSGALQVAGIPFVLPKGVKVIRKEEVDG